MISGNNSRYDAYIVSTDGSEYCNNTVRDVYNQRNSTEMLTFLDETCPQWLRSYKNGTRHDQGTYVYFVGLCLTCFNTN